jgi:uncharacterized protein YecT (DUF1311 family)
MTRIRIGLFGVGVWIALATPASAQERTCDLATTTQELASCFRLQLAASEDSLLALQAKVTRRTPGLHARALKATNAAWRAYRDKECAIWGAFFSGGSLAAIAVLECRIALTRSRSSLLESLLHNVPER